MDLEHELKALDQASFSDGIHFDSITGQAWINRVFQERVDELEIELFDTGALRREERRLSVILFFMFDVIDLASKD